VVLGLAPVELEWCAYPIPRVYYSIMSGPFRFQAEEARSPL
jgi:hypothetical protein